MPDVAFEVIRVADQAESSASTVAATLSRDPSLSARVLRLANSAFYGMARDVHSIQEAVVVLGMRTTKSLSLVAASFPWLNVALKGKGLSPKQLWSHCLTSATLSKKLSHHLSCADAEQAFCISLLHDMGTVALYLTLEDEYKSVVELAHFDQRAFDVLERENFGFDHAELGAALAESWNLPKSYCQSIRYHHRPSDIEGYDRLTDIIHVADMLVRENGISEGLASVTFGRDEQAFARLGIDEDMLQALAEAALQEVKESGFDTFSEAA